MNDKQINPQKIVLGVSGASGAVYAWYALRELALISDVETHLIISDAAFTVIEHELPDFSVDDFKKFADYVYDNSDLTAGPASGSFDSCGMLIIPCSLNTASSVAAGLSGNLMLRAAQNHLKEGLPLLMLLRETPLASHHFFNFSRLPSNAVLMPASPFFYHNPSSVEELIRPLITRSLKRIGLNPSEDNFIKWTGKK